MKYLALIILSASLSAQGFDGCHDAIIRICTGIGFDCAVERIRICPEVLGGPARLSIYPSSVLPIPNGPEVVPLALDMPLALPDPLPPPPQAPEPQPSPLERVPEANAKCGPRWLGGCWSYTHQTLSAGATFRSPHFYIPTGAWLASWAFDAELSHGGYAHHRCIEGNPFLPPYASRGQLYLDDAERELPLIGLEWMLVKLNRRPTNWIAAAMAGAAVGKHLDGGAQWLAHCW